MILVPCKRVQECLKVYEANSRDCLLVSEQSWQPMCTFLERPHTSANGARS